MSASYIKDTIRGQKIWIYTKVVDFRKQINGLVHIIESELNQSSYEGVYVFRNRHRDKLKILIWDRNGYLMGYKRLSRGQFDFPFHTEETVVITAEELRDLMLGMPLVQLSPKGRKIHTH